VEGLVGVGWVGWLLYGETGFDEGFWVFVATALAHPSVEGDDEDKDHDNTGNRAAGDCSGVRCVMHGR